jgi:hypothetical protein
VCAQAKCVARNVTFDVSKKIFVCADLESRGSILPFDLERSTGVDLREGADSSIICFDVAIASNAHPSASSGNHEARGQK